MEGMNFLKKHYLKISMSIHILFYYDILQDIILESFFAYFDFGVSDKIKIDVA